MNSLASRAFVRLALAAILSCAVSAAHAGPKRYLVIPFENVSSEPSLSWLGEAVAASIAQRLELLGMRTVGRRERLDAMEDLSLPPDVALSIATDIRVARQTRATMLVAGSFDYNAEAGVMVKARLIDLDSIKEVWQGSRSGSLAKIFTLMDPLVIAAAGADTHRVSPAPDNSLGSVEDPPLQIYEIIVRSQSEEEPERRLALLSKGMEIDPHSAPLLRALAFTNADAGRLDEALRIIKGIPPEKSAHDWRLRLLEARLRVSKQDFDGAMDAIARSIAAGESADAHLLMARLLTARGEKDRAAAEIDLAAGLDPNHPEIQDLRSMGSEAAQ